MKNPYLSIVIPVYNEEDIIVSAAKAIVAHAEKRGWTHELLLVENGSRDNTWACIKALEREFPSVHGLQVGSPGHGDYGLALKTGALAAQGELVINDEIDIGNFGFYDSAVDIFETQPSVSMVIGSKTLATSNDNRPLLRRFATWCVNFLLRILLGFKGTDTHGLKVWRRTALEDIVRSCVTGKDIFASEIVIRAERAGIIITEIPIEIEETRQARVGIVKRIPHVLKNIWQLFCIFHFKESRAHIEVFRYILIATLNVVLNLALFNFFILATGITKGIGIFLLTLTSYGIVIVNAFFWNKYWVFKHKASSTAHTYISFLVITILMAFVGSVITYILTTYTAPGIIPPHLWANIALLLTIPVTFVGNFLGNKLIVFRK